MFLSIVDDRPYHVLTIVTVVNIIDMFNVVFLAITINHYHYCGSVLVSQDETFEVWRAVASAIQHVSVSPRSLCQGRAAEGPSTQITGVLGTLAHSDKGSQDLKTP